MPALPSVPKVIKIGMQWALSEDLRAFVRFFEQYTGTPPVASDLLAIAALINTSVGNHLKRDYSGDSTYEGCELTDLSSSTAAAAQQAASIVGTNAGHIVPAGACVLQSRHVARRYRGGHPRVYWPLGCAEDLNDEQTWKATFVTQVATDLGFLEGDIQSGLWSGGGSLTPVAVSWYEGNTVFTGPTGRARNISTVRTVPIVDPIVATTVQHGVASQRKRLLRLA